MSLKKALAINFEYSFSKSRKRIVASAQCSDSCCEAPYRYQVTEHRCSPVQMLSSRDKQLGPGFDAPQSASHCPESQQLQRSWCYDPCSEACAHHYDARSQVVTVSFNRMIVRPVSPKSPRSVVALAFPRSTH